MTKPVLFRLTKTMMKLIKAGLDTYLSREEFKLYYDEVDKGILYKHTGNWVGGGLTSTFYALVYSIISNFTLNRLLT